MKHRHNSLRQHPRREFLRILTLGGAGIFAAACGEQQGLETGASSRQPISATSATGEPQPTPSHTPATATSEPTPQPTATRQPAPESGRLKARPRAETSAEQIASGVQPLGLAAERDALLYVPAGYPASQPAGFVLLLHGAGGIAEHGLSLLQSLADEANILLLAPPSRRQTWDVILGGFGPDVAFIDRALEDVFSRFVIDPTHLAIGGFSDGASYALSLGLTNGDLFTHVIAFSPGFLAPAQQVGKPNLFISHGTRDDVLPIDRCSRRIVPQVQRAGYDVRYREFDGPHTVPLEISSEAVAWFTGTGSSSAATPT